MQSALAVMRTPLAPGRPAVICIARKAKPIGGGVLRLRAYMAAEAQATARRSFLKSKYAKRYSSLNQD